MNYNKYPNYSKTNPAHYQTSTSGGIYSSSTGIPQEKKNKFFEEFNTRKDLNSNFVDYSLKKGQNTFGVPGMSTHSSTQRVVDPLREGLGGNNKRGYYERPKENSKQTPNNIKTIPKQNYPSDSDSEEEELRSKNSKSDEKLSKEAISSDEEVSVKVKNLAGSSEGENESDDEDNGEEDEDDEEGDEIEREEEEEDEDEDEEEGANVNEEDENSEGDGKVGEKPLERVSDRGSLERDSGSVEELEEKRRFVGDSIKSSEKKGDDSIFKVTEVSKKAKESPTTVLESLDFKKEMHDMRNEIDSIDRHLASVFKYYSRRERSRSLSAKRISKEEKQNENQNAQKDTRTDIPKVEEEVSKSRKKIEEGANEKSIVSKLTSVRENRHGKPNSKEIKSEAVKSMSLKQDFSSDIQYNLSFGPESSDFTNKPNK